MDVARVVRTYPLGWTVASMGVGAAIVVLVLGVPALWTAEAAGWASAGATLAAVVAALVTAHRQLGVALRAAEEARETAFAVQAAEWRAQKDEDRQQAIRLAHAFARELSYARGPLITALLEWQPDRFAASPVETYRFFVDRKPFSDLVLLESCTDRLQGFEDADSFMLLTVLTTWQFFNSSPVTTIEEITSCPIGHRRAIAAPRVRLGLELLDLINEAINALHRYYVQHPAIVGTVELDLSSETQECIRDLRRQV